mmetsp:Transcript_123869/g.361718  ORF Transcript_123869/g.361718 Transcript_123869/m.361718 type:complete len:300 (-) Transcript_123869:1336-2235(-)
MSTFQLPIYLVGRLAPRKGTVPEAALASVLILHHATEVPDVQLVATTATNQVLHLHSITWLCIGHQVVLAIEDAAHLLPTSPPVCAAHAKDVPHIQLCRAALQKNPDAALLVAPILVLPLDFKLQRGHLAGKRPRLAEGRILIRLAPESLLRRAGHELGSLRRVGSPQQLGLDLGLELHIASPHLGVFDSRGLHDRRLAARHGAADQVLEELARGRAHLVLRSEGVAGGVPVHVAPVHRELHVERHVGGSPHGQLVVGLVDARVQNHELWVDLVRVVHDKLAVRANRLCAIAERAVKGA